MLKINQPKGAVIIKKNLNSGRLNYFLPIIIENECRMS